MIVFGERTRIVEPRPRLERLARRVRSTLAQGDALERHASLVGLFLELGEIVQGVLDHAALARGRDAPSEVGREALLALAHAVRDSFAGISAAPERIERALVPLARGPLPEAVETKTPEGYAYYAVYPELYGEAARREGEPFFAVGIRSIGTTLAAMVAAGSSGVLGFHVRPVGASFARTIRAEPTLAMRALAESRRVRIAIADEGPGLSGSSFASVAEWLARNGVPRDRLVFFPSHAGPPGPRSRPSIREHWARSRRAHLAFEDALLEGPSPRLARWLGAEGAPSMVDVSAGRWRAHLFSDERDFPPVDAVREARKLLVSVDGEMRLAKFAGLGAIGRAKLARASALARFVPRTLGLRHGFLVSAWMADARPCVRGTTYDRTALLTTVGEYLATLARDFRTNERAGASPHVLFAMARHNLAAHLGAERAAPFERWRDALPGLAARARPVEVDGRLHAFEWLVLPDGTFRKADALDHHVAHDLVGAQDVAWDLAGARIELSLDDAEHARLRETIARAGHARFDAERDAFYELAYLAFQIGRSALARDVAERSERPRIERSLEAYARAASARLDRL